MLQVISLKCADITTTWHAVSLHCGCIHPDMARHVPTFAEYHPTCHDETAPKS
ncbi:MAG: hypothetical protein HDS16_01685 [Bacteroides sp.]|nr:hypothetical protein [Bacteroides sp.]